MIEYYQKRGEEAIVKAEKKPLNFVDICKLADVERESLKSLDKRKYSLDKIMLRFEIGVTFARRVKEHLDNTYPIDLNETKK